MAEQSPSTSTSEEQEEHHATLELLLQKVVPVLAAVLLIAMLFLWQQDQGDGLRTEVSLAYNLAQTPEDLDAVAKAYPDQPEAPMALLQSASKRFNSRDFEGALNTYSSFLSQYSAHPLREYAEWGTWMTQEQLGELESAIQGFRSVTEDALFYPQAMLAQARILEKQGKNDEAIAVYTKVQEKFAETLWAEQARVFSQQASLSSSK